MAVCITLYSALWAIHCLVIHSIFVFLNHRIRSSCINTLERWTSGFCRPDWHNPCCLFHPSPCNGLCLSSQSGYPRTLVGVIVTILSLSSYSWLSNQGTLFAIQNLCGTGFALRYGNQMMQLAPGISASCGSFVIMSSIDMQAVSWHTVWMIFRLVLCSFNE